MGGADEFIRRTMHLDREVGDGEIVAGCLVDQPYAQRQHETMSYQHPRGGRAKYLGGPLLEQAFDTVEEIARNVITEEGSDLKGAMKDFADKMADEYVAIEAPVWKTPLRNSGEPWVKDGGMETYRRPSRAPREPDGA